MRLQRILACLALAALLHFQIRQIVTASVLYDDAFIASVAKNLALGLGYSTSYHGSDLFDPEISTGPAVIFPTALLMLGVGNKYWVPDLAITIAIWAGLIALFWCLRRSTGRYFALAIAIVSAGLLMAGSDEYGLLGELPAALLVGCAFALLSDSRRDPCRDGFMAGIVLGLAISAKLVAVFVLPALVAVPLIEAVVDRTEVDPFTWRRLGWCCAGLCVPLVIWQAYRLIALSGSVTGWLALTRREVGFLAGSGSLSGIGQLREGPSLFGVVARTVRQNVVMLSGYTGGRVRLLPGMAAMTASLKAVFSSRNVQPSVKRLLRYLCFAMLLHFAWWLALSPTGWFRHLLPGVVYLIVLIAVLLPASLIASWRAGAMGAVGLCLSIALVISPWQRQSSGFSSIFDFGFEPQPRLSALLQTRAKLIELEHDRSVLLVGCGWWVPRDLEYVLPEANNFRDCYRLTPKETMSKRIVLVRDEYFNKEHSVALSGYQAACEQHVIYRNNPYVVSECPGLPTTP